MRHEIPQRIEARCHTLSWNIPTVSLIIPTMNEAQNLPLVLPLIPTWVHEVIIVDGHSSDNTCEVAKSLRPDVRTVQETRRGKGAALRAGLHAATGEIVATIDADGSMDPGELIFFVASLMAGADFAKGSRFIQGGGTDDMSWLRMLGNWALTHTARAIYGSAFSDLCYGYNAFWRRHLPLLNTDCDGFEIETALNLSALRAGLRITEIASHEHRRVHGASNLRTIPDGIRVMRTILAEMHRRDGKTARADTVRLVGQNELN